MREVITYETEFYNKYSQLYVDKKFTNAYAFISNRFSGGRTADILRSIRDVFYYSPAYLEDKVLIKKLCSYFGDEQIQGALAPVRKKYNDLLSTEFSSLSYLALKDTILSYYSVEARKFLYNKYYSEVYKSYTAQKLNALEFWHSKIGGLVCARVDFDIHVATRFDVLADPNSYESRSACNAIDAIFKKEFVCSVEKAIARDLVLQEDGQVIIKEEDVVVIKPVDTLHFRKKQKIENHFIDYLLWTDVKWVSDVSEEEYRNISVISKAKRKLLLDD